MLKKDMPKDRWGVPVPAEYSKIIGLDKGKPVYIDLDKANNRIILTASEKESDVNLVTHSDNADLKEYTYEEIADLIINILNEISEIKSKVINSLEHTHTKYTDLGDTEITLNKATNVKCAHCGKTLKDNEQLKINGKRICSNCKKVEVQKFLLYLERRKLDAKER